MDFNLHLVDGTNYAYRAHHVGKGGNRSFAVLDGMVRKLRASRLAPRTVVVLDTPGPVFRTAYHSGYKPGGAISDEGVASLVLELRELVPLYGMGVVWAPRNEADDLVATAVRMAVADGMSVVISTPDKDLMQLVTAPDVEPRVRVRMPAPGGDLEYSWHHVREKMGVDPPDVRSLLALAGDPVDGIPGVPKCGPKTAAWLINAIGDVSKIAGASADDERVSGRASSVLRSLSDPDVRALLLKSWDLAQLDDRVICPELAGEIRRRDLVPRWDAISAWRAERGLK